MSEETKKITSDELFELFGGFIPYAALSILSPDGCYPSQVEETRSLQEIRAQLEQLSVEWKQSGGPQVQEMTQRLQLALQVGHISLFDIGGWYQILEYRKFVAARREADSSPDEHKELSRFFIQEMGNKVILSMHRHKVIDMSTFHTLGIKHEHIKKALEVFNPIKREG